MKNLNLIMVALAGVVMAFSACKKNDSGSEPKPEPKKETVTDICGNKYSVVKIGTQTWMAENMACTKYDTESELAGGVIAEGDGKGSGFQPYYMDSRIKEKWTDKGKFADNISDEQIKKLGLLYNWAAAMGYTNEEALNQTRMYDGNRQGICPNGWHLPSQVEWHELESAIKEEYDEGKTGTEGKHLKSSSGWFENGNGTDDKGFCVLPAGGSDGDKLLNVGYYAQIWTSTAYDNEEAYDDVFMYNSDDIVAFDSYKKNARSVRCLKNSGDKVGTTSDPVQQGRHERLP
ncbi:MAG: hypothetical protein MJ010_03585 [Paludibacteraceae bacterium]|nr:hypothetical protein [Paludibacteraceae bacterium]